LAVSFELAELANADFSKADAMKPIQCGTSAKLIQKWIGNAGNRERGLGQRCAGLGDNRITLP
jgi:hypothetical protein